jgi:hypothetical protein
MRMPVSTLLCAAAITLIGAMPARAQVTETITFKTTFPFTVGNTTYPAGSFTVKRADDNDLSVLEITNGTTGTIFEVQPESAPPTEKVKDEVVFKKYGEHYVLSDIWDSADASGARAQVSRAEQRHAKKHGGEPTKTSVKSSRMKMKSSPAKMSGSK